MCQESRNSSRVKEKWFDRRNFQQQNFDKNVEKPGNSLLVQYSNLVRLVFGLLKGLLKQWRPEKNAAMRRPGSWLVQVCRRPKLHPDIKTLWFFSRLSRRERWASRLSEGHLPSQAFHLWKDQKMHPFRVSVWKGSFCDFLKAWKALFFWVIALLSKQQSPKKLAF